MALKAYSKTRSFIKKLQKADEKTKKIWLFGTSALSMVIIVGLWVVYLGASMPRLPLYKNDEVAAETKSDTEKESVLSVLARGFENFKAETGTQWQKTKKTIEDSFNKLKGSVGKTNSFSIESKDDKFVPVRQGIIPTSTLP
jgi:hypothetical protein